MTQTPTTATGGKPAEDTTGRDRMMGNVIWSMAAQMIFIAAGFVIPRLVHEQIGQAALGVWDFGWSLIAYFGLVSGGVMGSVSRYVARYRDAGDTEMLNTTVSTGLAIYMVTGMVVLAGTAVAVALLPVVFASKLSGLVAEGQWVVALLGVHVMVQFVFAVYQGVITGCHRWGAHNAVAAGVYMATTIGMILAVTLGAGLIGMAAMTLAGETIGGFIRRHLAHRYCPELRVLPRYMRLRHVGELLMFGGKSMVTTVANLLLNNTNKMVLARVLGSASLAIFSRPDALVRNMSLMVNKYAHVLTPTASALDARTDRAALRELLIKGTRYSLMLAMPGVAVMAILGGNIVLLWMGPEYARWDLATVLALGNLATLSQYATYNILMGMNRHGLTAVAMLIAAAVSVVLTKVLIHFGMGLMGVALGMTIPLTIINTFVVPVYACRIVSLPLRKYLARAVAAPTLVTLPLAAACMALKLNWTAELWLRLSVSIALAAMFAAVYWRYAVPERIRRRLMALLPDKATAAVAAQPASDDPQVPQ